MGKEFCLCTVFVGEPVKSSKHFNMQHFVMKLDTSDNEKKKLTFKLNELMNEQMNKYMHELWLFVFFYFFSERPKLCKSKIKFKYTKDMRSIYVCVRIMGQI